MGVKVRERPAGSGDYWIFIDHKGKRRAKKIGRDRKMAIEAARKVEAKLALGDFGVLERKEPVSTFKDYAEEWLECFAKTALKSSTCRGYRSILDKHLNPVFGRTPINEITRSHVKAFIARKIKDGMTVSRIKRVKASLSGIFTHAFEDGLVQANPAAKLDRLLSSKDRRRRKKIDPYTAEELAIFLDAIKNHFPEHYTLFLTLARTGVRLGECLGLQWGDIDFQGEFINIERGWVDGKITTPKNGEPRRVDATPQLLCVLKALRQHRKEQTLRKGWGEVPEWVFINEAGAPLDAGNLRGRVHYKACEKAQLRRVRIHDIRHSYATIRISRGHNIADVSRQLGHSSIKITVDTYYHWMPSQNIGEVAELDEVERNSTQPIRNQKEKGLTAMPLTT